MSDVMWAMVDLPAEVHAIPGHVKDERFVSDCPHEMSKDCKCGPVTVWNSAAHPRPLYEHRNYDQGPVHRAALASEPQP